MFKWSTVVAALLVPALGVSAASAAPKKKKPKAPTPAASATVAPPAATPSAPMFDTKPSSSALQRVENGVSAYSPKDAPPPKLTPKRDEPTAASATTLTSADARTATPRATAALAVGESDVAARPNRGAFEEGLNVAPVADFGTSKVYGLGFGARLGYTLPSHFYLGATFHYHLGGTNGPMTYSFFYVGPEVGYDVALGPVVVRPFVGAGFGSLSTTYNGEGMIPGGGGTGVAAAFHGRSQTAFLWPGAAVFLPLGNALAVGADVRVLLAPGQDASTGTLANGGALTFSGPTPSTPSSTALAAGLTAMYRF